ncbi:MAG: hypothetical protein KIT58_00170 [Planctomycetota bacterium]|nr:hypothetical protein [Planctomycetota bacterium]
MTDPLKVEWGGGKTGDHHVYDAARRLWLPQALHPHLAQLAALDTAGGAEKVIRRNSLNTGFELVEGGGGGGLTPESTRTINVPTSATAADIQTLIDGIGKFIPYGVTVTVQFASSNTHAMNAQIVVSGFFGGGSLTLQGDTTQTDPLNQTAFLDWLSVGVTNAPLLVIQNTVTVTIRDLKIAASSDSGTGNFIYCLFNLFCYVFRCYIYGNSTANFSPLVTIYGCMGRVSTCKLSNNRYGINAAVGASIYADTNTGVTNAGAGVTNGLVATGGSLRASGNSSMGSNVTSNAGSVFT